MVEKERTYLFLFYFSKLFVREFSPHPWQNIDQSFSYVPVTENNNGIQESSSSSKSCNKIIDQYDMQDEISGCNHTQMQLRERFDANNKENTMFL